MSKVTSTIHAAQIPTNTVGARLTNTPVAQPPEAADITMDDIRARAFENELRRMVGEVASSCGDPNRRRTAVRRFQAFLDARPAAGPCFRVEVSIPQLPDDFDGETSDHDGEIEPCALGLRAAS